MDNVVGMVAVSYVSKEEDGGSSIVTAPEGRTTIGLTIKRTRWWMLTLRMMWWWMRPTLCLTRVEEEEATATTITGARGEIWTILLEWRLHCTFLRTRMGGD